MKRKSLSLIQAKAICRDFQHLVGKEFDENGKIIECIAVSPYDDINKWIFSQYFLEKRNCIDALKYYAGPYYDVLVIAAPQLGDKICTYTDLSSYLADNGLVSDFE